MSDCLFLTFLSQWQLDSLRMTYVGEWAKGLVSTLQASIASPAIPLEASTGTLWTFCPTIPHVNAS